LDVCPVNFGEREREKRTTQWVARAGNGLGSLGGTSERREGAIQELLRQGQPH
jgi:hypothetical protein